MKNAKEKRKNIEKNIQNKVELEGDYIKHIIQ